MPDGHELACALRAICNQLGMFLDPIKWIGVVLALILTAAAEQLETSVSIESHTNRFVSHMSLTGLAQHQEYRCSFSLPNEVLHIAMSADSSNRVVLSSTKTRLTGGTIATNVVFMVRSDDLGRASFSYSGLLGEQLKTAHVPASGPHYGFSSLKSTVLSLELVVPRCTLASNGEIALNNKITIATDYERKPFMTTEVKDVLRLGYFDKYIIHLGGELSITVYSPVALHDAQLSELTKLLHGIKPLMYRCRKLPDVTILSTLDSPTETYFPLVADSTVAMDLWPLTPERAVRFVKNYSAQVLANALNTTKTIPADELWLCYSLPTYYAIRVASELGLVDMDQFIYDRREDVVGFKDSLEPLSRIGRIEDIATRDYVGKTAGFLALIDIATKLRQARSELDIVVSRTRFGKNILGFKQNIVLSLGPFAGLSWWRETVESISASLFETERIALETTWSDSIQSPSPTLVFTRGLQGVLELCGCKANQAGGADRRVRYIRDRRIAAIDIGNFLPYVSSMAKFSGTHELELDAQIAMMDQTGYAAIVVGPNEWSHLGRLRASRIADRLIGANVSVLAPYRIIPTPHGSIALVGWSDRPAMTRFNSSYWVSVADQPLTFDRTHLEIVLDRLYAEHRDILLVGHIHPVTIMRVVERLQHRIRAILSTYDGQGPRSPRTGFLRNTYVHFCPGDDGATISELFGLTSDRYLTSSRSILLDADAPSDRGVRSSLNRFYNSPQFRRAAQAEEEAANGALSAHILTTAMGPHGSQYVGSAKCRVCHMAEYAQWATTPHASALKTLIVRRRDHHDGCVACHVVGFRQPSGYSLSRPVGDLANVGCEVCHGPGSLHARKPNVSNIVKPADRAMCTSSCHTMAHSAFDDNPDRYWRRVIHKRRPADASAAP